MKTIWKNHKGFIKGCYNIALYLSVIYGLFSWLRLIFLSIAEGDFLAFILVFVLQSFMVVITGLIGCIVWGTIAVVILFIPYLIVRGFVK